MAAHFCETFECWQQLPCSTHSDSSLSHLSSPASAGKDLEPRFLLQVVSDVHLEGLEEDPGLSANIIQPSAPNLALLGDIGNPGTKAGFPLYRDFLLLQASRFERVFVLCGNHEFYSAICLPLTSREKCVLILFGEEEVPVSVIKDCIREVCALRPNLFFLDQTALVFGNVRVIGCTLWAEVEERDRGSVGRVMKDYSDIHVYDDSAGARMMQVRYFKALEEYETKKARVLEKDRVLVAITGIATPASQLFRGLQPPDPSSLPVRLLRVADTVAWHRQELQWIQTELKEAASAGQTAVVLTHHAPVFQSAMKLDATSAAFATDLRFMFNTERKDYAPIALWAFGHTHICSDEVIGSTRLVSNPHGYRGALQGYRRNFVVVPGDIIPVSFELAGGDSVENGSDSELEVLDLS